MTGRGRWAASPPPPCGAARWGCARHPTSVRCRSVGAADSGIGPRRAGPHGHHPAGARAPGDRAADRAGAPRRRPGKADRHPRGRGAHPRAHRRRRAPGAGRQPGGRRRRERAHPAALGARAAYGRRRHDRRLVGGHAVLRGHDGRPAGQRRAVPAGHDGALRRPRAGDLAAARPSPARPALGARREPRRARPAGPGDGRALHGLLALSRGPRRAGAVQGAQRAALGRAAARAAGRSLPHLGERPTVGVRAGHRGRARWRGGRHRGTTRLRTAALVHGGRLRRRRRARSAPPPPRRRADRRGDRRDPAVLGTADRAQPAALAAAPGEPARGDRAARGGGAAGAGRLPHDLHRLPRAGELPRRLAGLDRAGRGGRGGRARQLGRHGARHPADHDDARPRGPVVRRRRRGGHRAGGDLLHVPPRRRGRRSRGADQRPGQGVARRDHPARGARAAAGLGIRAVRDGAAARLGGGRRARHRTAPHRLARLHRRRRAARRGRRRDPVRGAARPVPPAVAGRPARARRSRTSSRRAR